MEANKKRISCFESLLRSRQLDHTLTTALPAPDPHDEYAVAPTGLADLDVLFGGGLPRGQLSELVGPRSSGRASVLLRLLAAATGRGELVALIDALDMFDVDSAVAAGVDVDRLLWVRGHVVSHPGLCHEANGRALDQALKALALVLQAGNFGVVALDVAEAPASTLARLPMTTWLRLQRMVEGSQTACVLLGADPMARSTAGLTVLFGGAGGAEARRGRFDGLVFQGLEIEARVVRARWRDSLHGRGGSDVRLPVSTAHA